MFSTLQPEWIFHNVNQLKPPTPTSPQPAKTPPWLPVTLIVPSAQRQRPWQAQLCLPFCFYIIIPYFDVLALATLDFLIFALLHLPTEPLQMWYPWQGGPITLPNPCLSFRSQESLLWIRDWIKQVTLLPAFLAPQHHPHLIMCSERPERMAGFGLHCIFRAYSGLAHRIQYVFV